MRTIIIILAAFLLMTPGLSIAQMHGGSMHGEGQPMMGGQGMSRGGMQNMDMMNQMGQMKQQMAGPQNPQMEQQQQKQLQGMQQRLNTIKKQGEHQH